MRRFYCISVNEGSRKNADRHSFEYLGKNVLMWLAKDKILIEIKDGITIKNNILHTPSFYALLYRAHLAYALSFNGKLKVNSISVDGEFFNEQDTDGGFPYVYSRIGDKLGLSSKWKKKEFIETLLSYKHLFMRQNDKYAAVISFIAANSCDNEMERFSHLWTCMNSYYREFYKSHHAAQNNLRNISDADQIKFLLDSLRCGDDFMTRAERDSETTRTGYLQLTKLLKVLGNDRELHTFYGACWEEINSKKPKHYQELIEQIHNLQITSIKVLGIMLLEFPYYLRCNYFHGNVPIILFARVNGLELTALHVVNFFLKEFLSEKIPEMLQIQA